MENILSYIIIAGSIINIIINLKILREMRKKD